MVDSSCGCTLLMIQTCTPYDPIVTSSPNSNPQLVESKMPMTRTILDMILDILNANERSSLLRDCAGVVALRNHLIARGDIKRVDLCTCIVLETTNNPTMDKSDIELIGSVCVLKELAYHPEGISLGTLQHAIHVISNTPPKLVIDEADRQLKLTATPS